MIVEFSIATPGIRLGPLADRKGLLIAPETFVLRQITAVIVNPGQSLKVTAALVETSAVR